MTSRGFGKAHAKTVELFIGLALTKTSETHAARVRQLRDFGKAHACASRAQDFCFLSFKTGCSTGDTHALAESLKI